MSTMSYMDTWLAPGLWHRSVSEENKGKEKYVCIQQDSDLMKEIIKVERPYWKIKSSRIVKMSFRADVAH